MEGHQQKQEDDEEWEEDEDEECEEGVGEREKGELQHSDNG